jgi:hypothetical protein
MPDSTEKDWVTRGGPFKPSSGLSGTARLRDSPANRSCISPIQSDSISTLSLARRRKLFHSQSSRRALSPLSGLR